MAGIFAIETARLLSVGRVHANADWTMQAHSHGYWEFIYFLRGCGRVEMPHARFRPQQYHLMVYPPGLSHAEISDPVAPEETVFFQVEVTGAVPMGAPLLLPDPHGDLRWLCEQMAAEQTDGDEELSLLYLQAFLHLVERAWQRGIAYSPDLVEIARQYLHANFAQPVTLEQLAIVAEVSATHLSHRFTAGVGMSPMRYLQRLRVDEAQRLLATTALPIQQIARNVGYGDALYFTRVFTRVIRQTPTAYRRRTSCTRSSISSTNTCIVNPSASPYD